MAAKKTSAKRRAKPRGVSGGTDVSGAVEASESTAHAAVRLVQTLALGAIKPGGADPNDVFAAAAVVGAMLRFIAAGTDDPVGAKTVHACRRGLQATLRGEILKAARNARTATNAFTREQVPRWFVEHARWLLAPDDLTFIERASSQQPEKFMEALARCSSTSKTRSRGDAEPRGTIIALLKLGGAKGSCRKRAAKYFGAET